MKKVIALFLALLMAFSFMTVASATEEPTEPAPSDDVLAGVDLGGYEWILDLPFWTVGPALKFAKIAFKLVSAYLKVAKIFGLVEEDMGDMILGAITDLIANSQNGETVPETDAAAGENTAPAVA